MIKPKRLKAGDSVALVSLSAGMAGEEIFIHRTRLGIKRLKEEFGLCAVPMPNSLKGLEYLYANPKARAEDLMQAFSDDKYSAVFCMIGGDDTVRTLPFIDFEIIKHNPKIFSGYSDSTVNHFMMYKAGLTSFYGASVMTQFAENVAMHEYTKKYLREVLFEGAAPLIIPPSAQWTSEMLDWADENNNKINRKMQSDAKGYELLQGRGIWRGKLLGGCLDVLPMFMGTQLWPKLQEWEGCILFLETSEEYPSAESLRWLLRGLLAQGILDVINGILFAKPKDEKYYDEYQEVLKQVVGVEAGRRDMPILYNMNFGHTDPICILPYGVQAQINCEKREFSLLEAAVE